MNLSPKGIAILTESEGGHVLTAYPDSAGVPTIGPGMTFYSDNVSKEDEPANSGYTKFRYQKGSRVQLGDTISLDQSIRLFEAMYKSFEFLVDSLTTDKVNQNQFDALVHFVYNIGEGNYKTSRIREWINQDPNQDRIEREFFRWKKSGGKIVDGLIWRRHIEANLYMGRL